MPGQIHEQVPGPPDDEPAGDLGDQASRLQMMEEQAAITAALAGDVHGTDALDRPALATEPLEGLDALDPETVESSDDPLHAGGMPATDPEQAVLARADRLAGLPPDAFGLAEDGAAMALDEGGTPQPETD